MPENYRDMINKRVTEKIIICVKNNILHLLSIKIYYKAIIVKALRY